MNEATLRNDVMLQHPTLNDRTIFSTIMSPAKGLLDAIPTDDDYPDIA